MKKTAFSFLCALATALLLVACDKGPPIAPEMDCVDAFVQKNNLVPYSGQPFEKICTDMFLHFEYGGKDYLMHDNNCADMIAIPVDCDSVPLCQSFEDPILNDFFRNATYIKIAAIWP